MTIPAEILEELATGERNTLTQHPNDSAKYRPMTRQDVDGLVRALKTNPNITSIDLQHMKVGDEWLQEIGHALRGNASLKNLTLSINGMADDAAATFASVLKNHPSLESIQLAGNDMLTDVGIGQLAHTFGTCPKLKSINFNTNPIGSGGAAAIAQMMRRSPQLENLNLASCGIDKDATKAKYIAEAVPLCPNLLSLHVADGGVPQHQNLAHFTEGKVTADTNPNLFWVTPNANHLSALTQRNIKDAEAAFRPIESGMGDLEKMRSVDMARISPILPILGQMNARPNIRVDAAKLATARAYLQSPPEVDVQTATVDSLLAKDEKGFTALDHPATWKHIGDIASTLEKRGTRFDMDFLKGKNSRGETWLEVGLASAADKLIPVLNERGIQIRAEHLIFNNTLGDTVKRLPFDALLASGKPESLFTVDNLKGASQQEVSRLYDAVPEPQQHRINNLSALRQQLRVASTRAQGIGR
ncbi:MAG: hypothetical protein FJX23_00240 [Alphaproteobacteria bacterium]|nr:hypothetical protein [Alphaproteobacteria bacterium]